jgi:glycosyltransferase involved in cell wall biosynthesis
MIPYVVTVHGMDVFNAHLGHGVLAQWRRQRSLEVYEAAQTVICVSGKVQQILQAGMPQGVRSRVVYNSTDVTLFSPGPPEINPIGQNLLAVGDLIPTKGQELILKAIARLAPGFPQLHCQFIGEGPDRARLESLASELGIAQRVQFLGRRGRAEVAESMRGCSVFVLPSRSEGLGCVYLEAMACGKPVIACHGQGIAEIIEQGRNGWVIPPDGLDELVQALSTLLQSRDLSTRIGLAGRETILNRFTLSHQAGALAGIYREAIDRS